MLNKFAQSSTKPRTKAKSRDSGEIIGRFLSLILCLAVRWWPGQFLCLVYVLAGGDREIIPHVQLVHLHLYTRTTDEVELEVESGLKVIYSGFTLCDKVR